MLDAPRAGGERLTHDLGIGDQTPVGADDAFEAEALAEQAGEHRSVEAEPDLFELGADRHAVVRHDLAPAGSEGRREGLEVVFEVVARVDLLTAVLEVRVFAVLLGSAAGEVLGHRRDGADPERIALEAADVGCAELAGEVGLRPERLLRTRPAGLGREVDWGCRAARMPTARYSRVDVGEPLDELRVAGGGEAERLGPLRERSGQERRRDCR